jgi:site-specific DNA-adenine methylase
MKKYEYIYLDPYYDSKNEGYYYTYNDIKYTKDRSKDTLNLLNAMGQDGWEFVFVECSDNLYFRKIIKKKKEKIK